MGLVTATATFTRFANGVVRIVNVDGSRAQLSQDEAAELDNYLVATATALRSAQDEIAAAAIEAQQRVAIDEAQAITEVIP